MTPYAHHLWFDQMVTAGQHSIALIAGIYFFLLLRYCAHWMRQLHVQRALRATARAQDWLKLGYFQTYDDLDAWLIREGRADDRASTQPL